MLSNPEKQGETNFNSFNSVLFNPVYQNIISSSCNQYEKLLRYFIFFFCVCWIFESQRVVDTVQLSSEKPHFKCSRVTYGLVAAVSSAGLGIKNNLLFFTSKIYIFPSLSKRKDFKI